MSIPEHQLEKWSALGAQTASANTYASIKRALDAHDWPREMNHTVYLQGSYPNYTNIRGDSDVDVVVETSNTFYHDLSSELRARMEFVRSTYGWREFRSEVKAALSDYYAPNNVRDSRNGKCIKVAGSENRLKADVVPCATFKRYKGINHVASGITFWTRNGVQVVNYPKLHIENGSRKNSACSDRFKPIVRVYKNARNEIGNDFPSYFLECLLYNAPTRCFAETLANSFRQILFFLNDASHDGSLANFRCQNEQQNIFGNELHQTNLRDAQILINELLELWNNWI